MATANTGNKKGNVAGELYQIQNIFAEEAFEYLMQKALLYDPAADSFDDQSIEFPDISKYTIFNHNIGKAILVLAHNFREEHTKIFKDAGNKLKHISHFRALVTDYNPTKHLDYFDGFLHWMAFIFNMTLFCFYEGYDYRKIGQTCVGRIPDIKRFYPRGGWYMLEKCAKNTACHYDGLSEDITKGLLKLREDQSLLKNIERLQVSDDYYIPTRAFKSIPELIYAERILESFLSKLKVISNVDISKVREQIPQLINFLHEKDSFIPKLQIVSNIDINRLRVGYKVVIKDESLRQSTNRQHPKASHVTSDQEADKKQCVGINKMRKSKNVVEKNVSSECDNTQILLKHLYAYANVSSEEFLWEEDDKKSVFLVSESYIEREDTPLRISEDERWKCKHAIKIHSPSNGSKRLVKNMFEVVKENIENKNYRKVMNKVIAICPPGCDIDDDDTRVVVLDTSSDDEETPVMLRPKQWVVMLASINACNTIKEKSTDNIAAAELLQRMAITTESEEGALAKNTGARPKVKKPTLPKDSAPKVKQASSADSVPDTSQRLGPSNVNENKSKSNKQKTKKSNWRAQNRK